MLCYYWQDAQNMLINGQKCDGNYFPAANDFQILVLLMEALRRNYLGIIEEIQTILIWYP